MDLGHWVYSGDNIDISEHFGFIYEITHTPTGKWYIGMKQLWFQKKRPPLKGKKRKRITKVESDWRTYTSSSRQLCEDIEKFGKEQFAFEIIEFYNSKSALSYFEAKRQFETDALLSEKSYNGIINLRISKVKL